MRHKLPILIAIILSMCFNGFSQPENTIGFPALTKKGSWSFGVNYRSFGLTWFITENKSIIISGFNPFISYYVHDRLSLNLSYTGIKTYVSSRPEYAHYYNNAELGITYILAKQKRVNFSFDAGYFFGQYRPYTNPNNWWKKQAGSMVYLGAGLNWHLKKFPQLAIQLNYRQYFNLNSGKNEYLSTFNTLSFGFTYFFSYHKKRKAINPFD